MGILLVVLLSAGCTGAFSGIQNTVPATPVSSGTAMNQTPDTCTFDQLTRNGEVHLVEKDSCYFRTHTPMEYLDDLRMHPDRQVLVLNVPDDWITLHDAELLMKETGSREPAAPVVSLLSSYLPFNQTSTVGNEALFLLEGYRYGKYPPGLCSLNYFRPDRTGVRAWWNSYGKQGFPDERNAGRIARNMRPGLMANQITMQVVMVDENADAEYTTVWLTPSERIYKLAKNIPDYKTYIGLMEQSKKDGSLLTFTLDTQDSSQGFSIIKNVVKGVQPASSSNEEKAVQVPQPSSPDVVNQADQITMINK